MGFVVRAVKSVATAVVNPVVKLVDTVVNTVKAVIADPLPTLAAIAGQAVGIPAPVTMAAITGARGGDLGDMAKAATIAYVAPQAASQVSAALAPTVSTAISNPAVASAVTNATSKALVNGTIAEATGGDFGEAAAGTMAGSLAASGYQNLVAPSVVAKAQEMGLSAETAKDVSAGLRTGIAAGTATAVSGGDFVAGFATAIAEEGIEATQANVAQALKDAAKQTKTAFEESSGTGLTTALVDQVPVSPNAKAGTVADADGNAVGSIHPFNKEDAFKQVVAAFEEPTTPSKQFGLPTAALAGAFIPEDQTRTDQPKVSLPEIDLKPTIVDQSDVNTLPKIEVVASPDEWEADQDLKDLKNLYKASTGKELLPSFATSTASAKQKVEEAKAEVNEATVAASVAPTPENIEKAQEAQANLELNQKILDDVVKQAELPKPEEPIQPPPAPLVVPEPLPEPPTPELPPEVLPPVEVPLTPEIEAKVEEAKAAAVEAAVVAQIAPTPENIQAAQDAQLNAELIKQIYKQTVATPEPTPMAPEPVPAPELPPEAPYEVPPNVVMPEVFAPEPSPPQAETTLAPEPPLQPSGIGPSEPSGLGGIGPVGGGTLEEQAGGIGELPGVIGGLGGLGGTTPEGEFGELPPGELPPLLPGGLPGVLPDEGVIPEEGYPQLPPVEVVGESPMDEAALEEELAGQTGSQQFPLTPPQQRYPTVTYNYFGSPEYQRRLRARRMRSPLAEATGQEGALGDLGSGIVFIGDVPYQYLQPSLLARGGLIRLKKV